MPQKLPLDFSDFKDIRLEKYLYVDKTRYIYQMLSGGRNYFLSRPRRFGKSLLVSALTYLLQGRRELFEGLSISKNEYHWQPYGVIKLDFSARETLSADDLRVNISKGIIACAHNYGISVKSNLKDPTDVIHEVVPELYSKFRQVALLIDEYDSPILRSLHDEKNAIDIRDAMRGFFSSVKTLDAQI